MLGPHAADAQAHAADPEAGWVREPPGILYKTYKMTAPTLTRRVYGYLPYWESIDLVSYHWDLITDVIAFSVGIGADGTVTNSHSLPGAALVSAAHAHGVNVHLCATLFNSSGRSEIATFLASPAARAKAVQQLVALANGIDGLNLDFEFVPSGSRAQVHVVRAAAPRRNAGRRADHRDALEHELRRLRRRSARGDHRTPPEVVDGGADLPPVGQVRGCAQAGAPTWACVIALVLSLRNRRKRG